MIAAAQGKSISLYCEKFDAEHLNSEGIHSGKMVLVTKKQKFAIKFYVEVYDETSMRPHQSSHIEWKTGEHGKECHIKLLRNDFELWILRAENHSKHKLEVSGDTPRKHQVIDFNKEGLGRDQLSKTHIEELLKEAV